MEQLQRIRFSLVTLWVLKGNARAISFYERHGFKFDGATKTDERDGFSLHELRMRALIEDVLEGTTTK